MTLEERMAALEARVMKLEGAAPVKVDLNDKYSDPDVRKDPRDWTGPSMVGKKYSQCSSEYLEMLAGLLDWQANKDDEAGKTWTSKDGTKTRPSSTFARTDAARARAWAARNKEREPATGSDADVPF